MSSLHQDIDYALAAYAAHDRAAGLQAEHSLKAMLPGYTGLPSHLRCWQNSCLTGDGFPLEFAFSASDASLRYTVDVMPEQFEAGSRLANGVDFLQQRDKRQVPEHVIKLMQVLQSGPDLEYGAWMGGRHLRDSSQYKLYSEINLSGHKAQAHVLSALNFRIPQRSGGSLQARMLGYNLDSSTLEVYLRGQNIASYELPLLLGAAGLSDRADELQAFIETAYGHCLRVRLPGGFVGVSYALSLQGEPRGVCLFFPARQFWGSDARIRKQFIAHNDATSPMLKQYIQISRPLKHQQGCLTRHGMLGISISPGQSPQLNIGLRPWAGLKANYLRYQQGMKNAA